jgi:hypothetical protein
MMAVVSMLAALALATAGAASAAQRIDMKVLVLGTSATEPDFASWQAALQREGVPFESIVTSPGHAAITAATLSDTLANGTAEAKYQAVIVSVGGLPECTASGCVSTLSAAEWTALEEYEHTFNVRQLTGDIYPGSGYGLNTPASSGALDGTQGTLTTEGKAVFPYLKGTVGMDTGTYGYEATPLTTQVAGASFAPLVSGPSGSALVGIYTHPNGVQEMVESFDQNQYQLQAELLRHGALNWVTRGVYFGDQRNYYEANIDDNFLSDDSWSTTEHTTDYNPADVLRETPVDVEYAAKWSAANKFRIDMLFNGGGSSQYSAEYGSDPLLAAFQKYKNSFGWISHTWDHPNLDIGCASQTYIESELNENNAFATGTLGLTASTSATAAAGNDNPSVIITGEHSGLANLLPGNPGVVDPPALDTAEAVAAGSLAPGSYVYAVTDDFTPGGGQSIASESAPVTVTSAAHGVTLTWAAVCHAAEFKIYRELQGSNEWKLIAKIPAPTTAPPNSWFASPLTNQLVTGGGPLDQTYTDTGAAGSAASAPPASSEAVESAYAQNPSLIAAFTGVGIKDFGSDASKPYPNPAIAGSTAAAYAAGSTFTDGPAQAIPRYPTNIYYNVSTEAEEVDEYNTLYTPVAQGGKCVASAVTTCETSPASFAEVVKDVDTNMFQHVMGNDPRPHYFHQPNIMGSPPAGPATTGTPPATSKNVGDGLFYSVLNPLLEEYNGYFSAPIEQPTMAQVGALLAEQSAWSAAVSSGKVSGYIEGNKVTITNSGTAAISAPLTGVTGVGSVYGGIQSGWTSLPVAVSSMSAPTAWPAASSEAPAVATSPASKTVTPGESATFTAAGSGIPAPTVQWQVSTNAGVTFANDTTDAGNTTGTLTVAAATTALSGREYRAVFTNASGSATSAAATLTVPPTDAYGKVVDSFGPAIYWPLADAAGSTGAVDLSGNRDTGAFSSSGITYQTPSPVEGSTGQGLTLSGGHVFSTQAQAAPSTYSQELWFKTTTAGGALATFGNSATGANGDQDRMVYMTSAGRIDFGVWTGQTNVIQSPGSYNDGKWHFLVATQGSDGMRLYIDGTQVATGSTTTAQSYTGYWQLGIAANSGWPERTTGAFAGSISDAAEYVKELTSAQVLAEYQASPSSAAAAASSPAYVSSVLAVHPSTYWRLSEASGASGAADSSGNGDSGNYSSTGVTYGVSSPVEGATGLGITLSGGQVVSSKASQTPTSYSEALWFKTTSTSGGVLATYAGPDYAQDRVIYMTSSGQLEFGVWTGVTNAIESPSAYNDGKWHFVVATQSSDGMHLYLDGKLIATGKTTAAQSYVGYWQLGGVVNTGWPNRPSASFSGSMSDAALWAGTELSATQIAGLYAAG